MALKSADDWNQDFGLHNCEQAILQIQADALEHALSIACTYELPVNIRNMLREEMNRLKDSAKASN